MTMSNALKKEDLYATPDEYLCGERVSETKHEYLAGMIYAMAGASRAHNLIAVNLIGELRGQLRGKRCAPFGSDMRLRIRKPSGTFYYYPDVTVDCSGENVQETEEPTAIVEILSPDTERADRGDKLINYQSIPSMRVYVLVDQFKPAVTVYRRGDTDAWEMEFLGDITTTLDLPEIGCSLPLTAIYERLSFSA
jgi:Uma2 family endonuclease